MNHAMGLAKRIDVQFGQNLYLESATTGSRRGRLAEVGRGGRDLRAAGAKGDESAGSGGDDGGTWLK
jgi:hypothetical protein